MEGTGFAWNLKVQVKNGLRSKIDDLKSTASLAAVVVASVQSHSARLDSGWHALSERETESR
ncbi:MAG: hypothetical protein WD602_06675 [Actinomycetota bacterium]